MLASRTAIRAQRVVRTHAPAIKRNARFYADESAMKGGGSGAVAGGLAGASGAALVGYAWYHFSGTKSAVQTAQSAKGYIDQVTSSFKVKFEDKTPDTNQAIQTLRDTANKYASFIPGGRGYVDSAFDDLDAIRKKHGGEVDQIVSEAYSDLRDVSNKGLSLDAAGETWSVLSKHIERLASLAGDAAEDIMNNHPELKEKLGGSTDQLKQLGERLGPEAKKQVNETWDQVNDIVKQGLSFGSIEKIRQLITDKTKQLRKMSEEAFNQGFEQIKPMLEKNPQAKKLVEENMDHLKQGNVSEVVKAVQSAVSSGSTQDLEKYINQ